MLNYQDTFNTVLFALREQGEPSVSMYGGCYYRHPDNPTLKCGVGHLISDEDYSPVMDTSGPISINKYVQEVLDVTYRPEDIEFLRLLQEAHDDAATDPDPELGNFMQRFESNMRFVAQQYNLEVPANG